MNENLNGERKELLLRIVLMLGSIFIGLSILTIGYLVDQVRDVQRTATARGERIEAIVKDSQSTAALLADCTTPGGKCFEEGQKRQGQVLRGIGDQFVYAIYCNNTVPKGTVDEIRKCMEETAKAEAR